MPRLDKEKGPRAGEDSGGGNRNRDDVIPANHGPQDDIERYVACVFEPDDLVEVRRIPSGQSSWQPAAELPAHFDTLLNENQAGQSIYLGANPRRRRGGRNAASVALARCLFVDFDNVTIEQARARLREAELPEPTVLLFSGHGVHAYWRLTEPFTDLDAWSAWQKDLAALLDSDPAVHDPPRIMRLPGFINLKEPERPVLCAIINANATRVYDLSDFHAIVPHRDAEASSGDGGGNGRPTPESDNLGALAHAASHVSNLPGVRVGERNGKAVHIAALLTHDYSLTDDLAWPILREWNTKNHPPLDEKELRTCLTNGLKYGKNESGCKRIVGASSEAVAGTSHARPWPDPPDAAAFYGLAGDFVRAIEEHTEADPVALLIQFIGGFGNVIGPATYFVVDGAEHRLNLFAVLVGATSKGRKGTSWAHVVRLLSAADPSWAPQRVVSGMSSGEGLIWQVRDPITKRTRNSRINQVDESIIDHGIEDKRLFVQESEFAFVLRVLERDGNTLSAIIRQAWDQGNLRVLTKNCQAAATGAHISIVAHITADELRRYLSDTESGNGFGNRFLWICVRRARCLPHGGKIEAVDFSDIHKRLCAAADFARMERRIALDSEARRIWEQVYPELSDGRPGLLGALLSRAEAQAMRLAAIYAMLDCSETIRPPHLNAALAICDYCERSAQHIFGDALGDEVADAILRALRSRPGGMTRTEIGDLFKRHKSSMRIEQALTLLAERHLIRPIIVPTGGRPAERWVAVEREKCD